MVIKRIETWGNHVPLGDNAPSIRAAGTWPFSVVQRVEFLSPIGGGLRASFRRSEGRIHVGQIHSCGGVGCKDCVEVGEGVHWMRVGRALRRLSVQAESSRWAKARDAVTIKVGSVEW